LSRPKAPDHLRIEPYLEPGVVQWAEGRSQPGGVFYSLSHAAEVAIQRILDEQAALRNACAAHQAPFDVDVYWRLHAQDLRLAAPNPEGRPRRDAGAHTPRAKRSLWMAKALLAQIQPYAQPDGPFAASNPTAHFIEYALRVLREADPGGPWPSVGIPMDEGKLWAKYSKLRKSSSA
jgi:hypothetical protein